MAARHRGAVVAHHPGAVVAAHHPEVAAAAPLPRVEVSPSDDPGVHVHCSSHDRSSQHHSSRQRWSRPDASRHRSSRHHSSRIAPCTLRRHPSYGRTATAVITSGRGRLDDGHDRSPTTRRRASATRWRSLRTALSWSGPSQAMLGRRSTPPIRRPGRRIPANSRRTPWLRQPSIRTQPSS